MPEKDPYSLKVVGVYAIAFFFSVVGGLAKLMSLSQTDNVKFTLTEVLSQSIISGFTGSLVTLYLVNRGYDFEIVVIGAGLGGFLGTTLLYVVSNRIFREIDPQGQAKRDEVSDGFGVPNKDRPTNKRKRGDLYADHDYDETEYSHDYDETEYSHDEPEIDNERPRPTKGKRGRNEE